MKYLPSSSVRSDSECAANIPARFTNEANYHLTSCEERRRLNSSESHAIEGEEGTLYNHRSQREKDRTDGHILICNKCSYKSSINKSTVAKQHSLFCSQLQRTQRQQQRYVLSPIIRRSFLNINYSFLLQYKLLGLHTGGRRFVYSLVLRSIDRSVG